MDLTSYLMGKKASGGGSSGVQIIFTSENESGVLDIKPSDIIDANGKLQNKYVLLKFEDETQNVIFPFYMTEIGDDTIFLGFGNEDNFRYYSYISSISEDNYFEHFDPNAGTH